jgi:hypothetical protein
LEVGFLVKVDLTSTFFYSFFIYYFFGALLALLTTELFEGSGGAFF